MVTQLAKGISAVTELLHQLFIIFKVGPPFYSFL